MSDLYWYKARVDRAVDGDTLDVDIDCGLNIHTKQRCRLYGIDTPETYGVKKNSEEYKQGMIAKEFVVSQLEGKEVLIKTHKDKTGKYGRYLVTVFLGEVDFNNLLVEQGYAVKAEY